MPSTGTIERTNGFADLSWISRPLTSAKIRPDPARLLYSAAVPPMRCRSEALTLTHGSSEAPISCPGVVRMFLEVRTYRLKPGTTDGFVRVMREESVPLLEAAGIAVLDYGA